MRSKIVLFAALALTAVALLGSPSAHAAAGIGTVNGQVTTSPGIGTTPAHQSIGFSSIVISGVFDSDDNSQQFAGTISVTGVTAQTSGSEDITMGTGTINYFPFAGSGVGSVNGSCGTSGVTGSAGTYQRVGGFVTVTLHCRGTVSGRTFGGTVSLQSLYIPTSGDGVTQPVTAASFDGTYQVM